MDLRRISHTHGHALPRRGKQRGKLGQPQNLPPALVPVLVVRRSMTAPHLGQAGGVADAVTLTAELAATVGTNEEMTGAAAFTAAGATDCR